MTSPAVAALAKALYGDAVDPAEFAKSVDAADVHLDAPLVAARKRKAKPGDAALTPMPVKLAQTQLAQAQVAKSVPAPAPASGDPKRDRRLAMLGLGTTGVAGVAGIHAIKASTVENAERTARAAGVPPELKAYKVPKILGRMSPKKAALVTGGAALGLHGVELVGDTLAARAQVHALKQAKADPVAKGMVRVSLKPANPEAVRRPVSLKARRPAAAPPPIAKGLRGAASTGRNIKRIAEHGAATTKNVDDITGKVARLIPKPKTAALALGGITATGIAGRGVATYEGTKQGVRRGMGKSFDAAVAISKAVEERKQVFGWANVSVVEGRLVVDRQGDIIPIEELEKAAYDYVQDSRVGADQHRRIAKDFAFTTDLGPRQTATMIESMVFTPDKIAKMGLPADFPQGWWIGMQIEDDAVWDDIRSGKRTGFSIHGSGRRTPIDSLAKYVDPSTVPTVQIKRKHVGVRGRLEQAKNPPPVRRVATPDSSMMASVGYQRQTRKLDAELRTRPGNPYSSRVRPKAARRVLDAPSKGKAWNAEIRAEHAPRHDHYTPADRARLFLSPVS